MTLLDLLLLCSSIAGWLMYATARRRHARELRRLAQEHKTAMASYGCHRFAQGLNHDKERRRTAQDWQEARRGPTTQEAVTRLTT